MLVELISNILTRNKVPNVVTLHLLDHLEGVADNAFQEACYTVSRYRLIRVLLRTSDASILNWAVGTEIHCRVR